MQSFMVRTIALLGRRMGLEIKRWRNPTREQVDRHNPLLAAQAFLQRHGAQVNAIIDVGANRGDFCNEALELFPSATVHCFEPTEEVYRGLRNRFGGNSRVHMHQNAVAEADGPIRFHVRAGSVWNSILENGSSGITPAGEREVEVKGMSLDSFARQESLDCIDLLKLDIQGAELLALRGARGLLAAGRIGLIQLEVNFQDLYAGQASLEEISGYLFGFGFWLQGVYQGSTSSGLLLSADAVFAHSRYLES